VKKLLIVLGLGLSCLSFGQSEDNPGSLWNDHAKNPLIGRTAKAEGDILTVIISEVSSATFTATTTTSKNDKTTVGVPQIPLIEGLFKSLAYSPTSSTNGTGSTSQAGKLTARMTVTVKKVLPNGLLAIEGSRWLKVNKDTQLVKLTGFVRPDDVLADNTVLSERIAEAQIRSEGSGQIADRQRQGIITRLLSILF
jgi:flagellar L-ring protein precursor FlgH